MPVFDTVLWDWNGTLLDDAALCCELLNTMLARHGYAPVGSMEAYRQVFCFPIETYYRRAGFDFSRHPFAALADEYMRLYTPRSLGCPLQPDACAVLDALRAQGMRQVMLSASKRENLQQQVEHFGLRSRFDTLLGLSDIYAKSKTEVGLRWLRESGTDPARIMMVGDSEHDFEVARALGVRCVLFSGGHQPREVLAATGAPVIDALAQLSHMENCGIRFTDIRPGFVATPLLSGDGRYPMLMRTEKVAARIMHVLRHPRRRVVIDRRYALMVFFWKLIPEWLWERLNIRKDD